MYSTVRRFLLPFLCFLTAALLAAAVLLAFPLVNGSVFADDVGNMTVERVTSSSKYENARYKGFYGVKSEEISSYTTNGGERVKDANSRFILANAFDGDVNGSTFWMSEQENSETFKNHIVVNFTKKLALKGIRYKSSYYSSGSVRNFSGYPTTLSVYTAIGDEEFTLAGVCVSTPQKDFSEDVIFLLPQTVECSKLKFEFTEVSVYNNTFSGNSRIAAAMDISFYKSDEGITDTVKALGNHENETYLTANSVAADEMKIRANGGGNIAKAFDKDTKSFYQSEAYNTDIFTNKITLTMDRQYTFSSIVYGCSWYTRDNARNFSGFPTMLKVTATKEDGTQMSYTFGGNPDNNWSFADFAFPEPVACKKIELLFSEVTTFSEIADGAPIVACSEIYLIKTADEETEEMLAEINGVFTDYAQYELNESCTAEYLVGLRARARLNSGYESSLKPVLDRAEAILSGSIKKDPYREFSTDPNAKNVIERNGALVDYCRNTLQMSSFGTDRQVIGIGGTTGKTITIYVEAEAGDPLPKVAFTQIYGAWNSWKGEYTLKRGKNEIVFPNFKANGSYTRAVNPGGPIHIINPYTPEQQSSNVKLYIEGGYLYPVFHDGDDEGTFRIILKDYYERLTDANDSSITVDAFEAVTDNVILSCQATLAYNAYVGRGASPQNNVNRWKTYTRNTLAFGGVEFDASKPYYNEKNNRIKVNYRSVQPIPNYYAYAANEHVGIIDSNTFGAMVTYWTLGWAFYHEVGHQLDNRRMMIGEVTNNMWSIYNIYMVDGAINDRINVSNVSKNLASDFSKFIGTYWDGIPDSGGHDNCDFWWIIEGASPGYWAKLQQLYCFEYGTTAIDKAVTNATERLCYYSSLATGEDMSEYFERWGFHFSGNYKFTAAGASHAFNNAMAAAKAAGRITGEGKKYWYVNNGQYRYELSHGGTLSPEWASCYNTSQTVAPIKIMGATGRYTLLLPTPQKPEAHLCYEIQSYIGDKWQVLGVTDGTSFADTYAYGDAIPQYRVYAYDRYFNHTGDPVAVSPHTGTQTNVCRISDVYYNSLKEAVTAANNTAGNTPITIYLLKDFEDGGIKTSRSGGITILPDPEIFTDGKSVTITKNASGHLIEMVWQATLGSAVNNVPTSSPIILDGGSFSQSGALIRTQAGQRARICLNNVTFQNNINSGNGGGLCAENGSYVDLNGCTIKNNRAANGGGIYTGSYVDIRIRGLTVIDNVATGNGGGIYAGSGDASIVCQTISGNYPELNISGNQAANGAGVYAVKTVELTNAQIINNTATQNGGGVYTAVDSTSRYIRLNNCTVKDNSAVNGGAIYMYSGATRLAGTKICGKIYKYYGASTAASFELYSALSDFTECEEIRVSKTIPLEGLTLCEVVTGIQPAEISEPAKSYCIYNGTAEFVSGTGIVVYPITATVTINYGEGSFNTEIPLGSFTLPDKFEQLSEGKYIEKYTIDGKDYNVGQSITVTGELTATATIKDYCKVKLLYGDYSEALILKQGTTYYLPMKTRDGEVIFGWDCSNGNYYAYAEGVEINRDMVFNAVIRQLHTVITVINGSKTEEKCEYGVSVTLPSPPAIFGKVFSHWEVDGKAYPANQTLKVTGDIVATAVYADSWKVVTVIEDDEQTTSYPNGYQLVLQDLEASLGREFKYWLIGGVKYYAGSTYTVSGDCEIVAVFAQINTEAEITVTLTVNKGAVYNEDGTVDSTVEVEDETVELTYGFNATHTFTAPAVNAGNEFLYWNVNGARYKAGETIVVKEAFTANAVVAKISTEAPAVGFTVSVKDYVDGTLSTTEYDYAPNSTVYLTQPSGKYNGKVFAYWLVGGERYEAGATFDVTENVEIEAVYDTAFSVEITQLVDGKESTVMHEYGKSGRFTLSTAGDDEDKIFSHWLVNGTQYEAGASFEVTSDTKVVAVYNDVEKINVIFKQLINGALTEQKASVKVGSSYLLSVPENVPADKEFLYWDVNGVQYNVGSKLIVLEETQVVAVYKDIPSNPAEPDEPDNSGDTDGGTESGSGNGAADEGGGSNAGLIAGIVIAIIVVLGAGIAVAVIVVKKRR